MHPHRDGLGVVGQHAETGRQGGLALQPSYWDYAIGVFLTSIGFALTLGSFCGSGMGAMANLGQAAGRQIADAMLSGALFNHSHILLVVAVDAGACRWSLR